MSSSTNITDPSPMTKPSRPRSNGRQAFSGSSLRSLVALIWQNAPMVRGVIVASDPPAGMVAIQLPGSQVRVGERLLGRGQRERAVAADVPGRLAVHVFLGVEALDLGRDLGVEVGRVEAGDPPDPGDPLDHVRPDGLHVV